MKNVTKLQTGMDWAESDLRASYSVGFYPATEPDGKFHRLEVNVNRRGVRLVHQRGYSAAAIATLPAEWAEPELLRAVRNSLGSSAVRLDARAEHVGNGVIDIEIDIHAEDLHFARSGDRTVTDLDIVLAEHVSAVRIGYEKQHAALPLPPGPMNDAATVRHTLRINLQPGTSLLKVLVRDRYTGRYGTLEIPASGIPPAGSR
jgi:hypothetical protein